MQLKSYRSKDIDQTKHTIQFTPDYTQPVNPGSVSVVNK